MSQNSSEKTAIAIYGAGGLTGRELIRLLARHPAAELNFISSNQNEGTRLADWQGEFSQPSFPWPDLKFSANEAEVPAGTRVIFLATPNDVSLQLVDRYYGEGEDAPVLIDLSGVYRIKDEAVFERVYKLKHTNFQRVNKAVFGLPETRREEIKKANLIANPGCYPTGSIGPLNAIFQALAKMGRRPASNVPIIIDGKSGVSGAGGRVEGGGFPFQNVYENFRAYKVLKHQHEPEIAQEMNAAARENFDLELPLVFTPHLLPMYRGILSTIYLSLEPAEAPGDDESNREKLFGHLTEICAQSGDFLKLMETPEAVELKTAQFTNQVRFSVGWRGDQLVIISAIDNLIKGAAGQAIQNMNLRLGLDEASGLG